MVIANYGYQDASGDYYITIDTDKCTGCGECAKICPKNILEMIEDDWQSGQLGGQGQQKILAHKTRYLPGCPRGDFRGKPAFEGQSPGFGEKDQAQSSGKRKLKTHIP